MNKQIKTPSDYAGKWSQALIVTPVFVKNVDDQDYYDVEFNEEPFNTNAMALETTIRKWLVDFLDKEIDEASKYEFYHSETWMMREAENNGIDIRVPCNDNYSFIFECREVVA